MAARMFEPGKISEHGFPRLGASEALLAVPLVRHFAETVLQRHPQRQRMQKEIRSLLSMCSAALAVQGAKRGVVTGAEVLRLTSEHVANHRHMASASRSITWRCTPARKS